VSLRASSVFVLVDVDTRTDRQDDARELERAPGHELGRCVQYLAAPCNQLGTQHELCEPAQYFDRNLAAIGYSMKQCGGSPMDGGHWHNAIFLPVTATEMSAPVVLADVFWPRAMWNFS